jgi:hypothetical protein
MEERRPRTRLVDMNPASTTPTRVMSKRYGARLVALIVLALSATLLMATPVWASDQLSTQSTEAVVQDSTPSTDTDAAAAKKGKGKSQQEFMVFKIQEILITGVTP